MYYNDHDPPHFHARYGSQKAKFNIAQAEMIDGGLGPRALRLVVEWAQLHKDELCREWELAQARQPLFQIEPLD